jgi:cell division septation protein DedD
MAVPRPLLLALIGVLLMGVTFTAARNARDRSDSDSSTSSAQSAPAPAKPKAAASRPEASASAPKAAAARPKAAAAAKPEAARPAHQAHAKPNQRPSVIDRQAAVARAIGRGRIVVLFFFQRHASDDAATAKAVRGVRGVRGVTVFTDEINHVGRYRKLIGAVGVSQAPATVIVDSKRRARLVEGYVDAQTLAQEVADAR